MFKESVMKNKSSSGVLIAKSMFTAGPKSLIDASHSQRKMSYPPILPCPLEAKYNVLPLGCMNAKSSSYSVFTVLLSFTGGVKLPLTREVM